MPHETIPTYESFSIHTIMPAGGWRAVYVTDEGVHFLEQLHALALVTRHVRACHSGEELLETPGPGSREKEFREVVGMEYSPDNGFAICDETGNFCGLLPPGRSAEEFQEASGCGHAPPQEDREQGEDTL